MTSPIAIRREFMKASMELGKASSPTQLQILAVTQNLAQLITNVTGRPCELVLRFPEPEPGRDPLPGQIDMGEVWEDKP